MNKKALRKYLSIVISVFLFLTVFSFNNAATYADDFSVSKSIIRLTNNSFNEASFQISSDGSKIAFINDDDNNDRNQVWVANSDGSGLVKIFSDGNYKTVLGPRHAPENDEYYRIQFGNFVRLNKDGSKIAIGVLEYANGIPKFYVMITDIQSMTRSFVETEATENIREYSPGYEALSGIPINWYIDDNFTKILYEGHNANLNGAMFIKNIGGSPIELYGIVDWNTDSSGNYNYMGSMTLPLYFDLSANGEKVVFTAYDRVSQKDGLYVINASGGTPKFLTEGGGRPQISGDGSKAMITGDNGIQIVDTNTGAINIIKANPKAMVFLTKDGSRLIEYLYDRTMVYDMNGKTATITSATESDYRQDGNFQVAYYSSASDYRLVNYDGTRIIQPTYKDSEEMYHVKITYGNPIVSTGSNTLVLQLSNPYMTINGAQKEIDPGRSTAPLAINGRTMLPIRAVIETMGGSIEWVSSEKKVVINYKDTKIELWLDNKTAKVNGVVKETDTAPVSINGRTMVPFRFIIENLGYVPNWDNTTKSVIVNY